MISSLASNISSEAIAELPLIHFSGKIIVVDSMPLLQDAIRFITRNPVLGFDTETKPSFRKGQNNKVAMLQLSSHDTCYIFRLNKIGFTDELVHLLSNNSVLKIGLSLKDDFRELLKLKHFHPYGFVDLQKYAETFSITDKSLKKLAALVLGHRISKSQQTSNWESAKLTEAQLIYAATDAWVCLEIYKHLKEIERTMNTLPANEKIPDISHHK